MGASAKISLFVASGFGIGLFAPFAPGTFGSLPGVLLAVALSRLGVPVQIAAALALAALAVPVCSSAEKTLGVKDDGRIVADEWMLFPLATVGIPLAALSWKAILAFFAIVRFLDIVKPPPARQLQCLKGGIGIVVDDFVANLYSLGVNWTVYLCFFRI